MREDFCAFILTHGRPDSVRTFSALEKHGYTGKVYLVVDDEDWAGGKYRERFGDRVLVFSKAEVARYTDRLDNFGGYGSPLWARNACWDLARRVGCRFFVQLDDDYTNFSHRRFGRRDGAEEESYHEWTLRQLDDVFEALVRFLERTSTLTIAMSQGGDHFGGIDGTKATIFLKRKAMNSFVCDVERPFLFLGRMNDDVNTYVVHGRTGGLFFTYWALQLHQIATQANEGGITDLYRSAGTYVKSFYTVMVSPSSVTVRTMGKTDRRFHHNIEWRKTVPKIIPERYRRVAA